MKKAAVIALMLGLFLNAFGFAEDGQAPYAASTPIEVVVSDPVFGNYGRLLFPVDAGYWSGRHARRPAAGLVQQHRSERDGGDRQHAARARVEWRDGVLRHLHRRGKGGRPVQGGHGTVLLQGRRRARSSPSADAGGGIRLCGRHAGQLSRTPWSCRSADTTPLR